MRLPEFLIDHPDGEIRLTGHRIGLYEVVTLFKGGSTAESLHEQYPSLLFSMIQGVLDFYQSNRVEVDNYVESYRAELDRQRSTAQQVGPSLPDMRRRMEMMRREEVH